jgi:hypothetical protein
LQHAIIYTSSAPPKEKSYEASDGSVIWEGLTKEPIKVIRQQKDQEGNLDEASRINYAKIFTVEKDIRVLNIGLVHRGSMSSLLSSSIIHPLLDDEE